ncbi:NB-ARC domain-containing protein [Coleofasciculus sp. FACHB-129]|uniref:NB-ARC domain-containing protein n=1 Tax=Cyanophyceae TaxID=3028117 RepID=UPI001686303D|nr:NB-ARC domain-containing protein [Coleofasciculus sp. FACHB-129]MBD1898136.1 NB-ARC domain-containing protein [Coleofasciculus sp. FACHB-129]
MASTLSKLEVEFTEAANNWNLEKLYIDLAVAKGKSLTQVEKKILRGLLCGYSPAEIADQVYQSRRSNSVRVYLSNGIYKYIEKMLGDKTEHLIKVKSWSRVIHLLEKAGYKTDIFEGFTPKSCLAKTDQKSTNLLLSNNKNQEWEEAIDTSIFYGREEELATLKQWIVKDHCRIVTILGMGGIGKTALSIRSAELIKDKFDYVIWRSLHHAPPIQDILATVLKFLSNNSETNLPDTVNARISRLIDCLRSSRCLLVLDNAEAILQSGDRAGCYRQGYEGYGELFRRVGETLHQSCLVLTSREKPRELVSLEGNKLPVRSLQLGGLKLQQGREIFKTKGDFFGSEDEWIALIDFYAGNPQILKIVATTILTLFQGNISQFLEQGNLVFGDICALLDQQFNRLSDLEKKVMYWLAIKQGSISLTELRGDLPPISQSELLETLESLLKRSLIENNSARFTQKPLITEYMTKRLIKQVFN